MTDRKWLVWMVLVPIAILVAKYSNPWVVMIVVMGLVWWSIDQDNKMNHESRHR